MDEITDFEEQEGAFAKPETALLLDLDGYEGPIDALLQLAREQKVDLTRISILALADQYLTFVARARSLRLELAADYLVMAAWLAYLKSRLLLPRSGEDDEPSGTEMAAALKFQLRRLEAMQEAGLRLMDLPRLGRDLFPRGESAAPRVVNRVTYEMSLFDLLTAYGQTRSRVEVTALRIEPGDLYSVEDALRRLENLLGGTPGWQEMAKFMPRELCGGLIWRSALASVLSASLEMSRQGAVTIRQDGPFQPIYLRRIRKDASELA